jgi:oligopeptide/dipeptide ABC transporter ATP-binding protein
MSATEVRATGGGPSSADNVIEVNDLHVTFTGHVGLLAGLTGKKGFHARAVDGITFELRRGEVLAIAGESGSGKTTTARAIMGLQEANAGSIVFEGKRIGKKLQAYRRRVQMVFQDPTGSLNPRQTIYEIIAEGLRIHHISHGPNGETEEQLVARALSRSGLRPPERFYLSYPHELSGGQRQRVVIAGALALDPEVIVADEPVSNLDASVRGEILQLLMQLRADLGLSIIIVTHDLGLAWTVADRIAVMYLGRLVELGPTEDVLLRSLHPYTRALLNVVPEAGGIDRPILEGEAPDPTRIPTGCRFHPRCPVVASGRAAELGILEKCTGEDLMIEELAPDHGAACWAAKTGGSSQPGSTDRPISPQPE